MTSRPHSLWPLYGAVFLDLLGFGMLIPDIQLRAEDLGASGLVIGAILGSMFVVQFVVSPHWGALSDRIGRKPVFLVCTGLAALGSLVYGLGSFSLVWILASRLLGGLGAANVAVANAFVADVSRESTLARDMGRLSAATTSGLIAGPAITALLAQVGQVDLVGYVAAGASLLGLLWVMFSLPAVRPTAERRPARAPVINFGILRENRALLTLALTALVAWFALASLEGTFGRLIRHNLGFGQREFGIIFGFESLLGVLVQAFLVGWLALRLGDWPLLRWGFLVQGVGLALTPLAPNFALLLGASGLYAIGVALANPMINTLCSRLIAKERQGELFGTLQGVRSFGFALGPVVGGVLFDLHPWTPYFFAGGVCLLAVGLVSRSQATAQPVPT